MALPSFLKQNRITAAVLGLICLLVVFGVWNLFQSPDEDRLAAIRAKGYPVTLAELNTWYKAVPPEQNAALVYTNAFALTKILPFPRVGDLLRSRQWMPRRGQSLTPEVKADLEKLIATNLTALRIYHSAPSGQSRYPVDFNQGFRTLMPHLTEIRKGVSLLNAEAWVHMANGDTQECVESLLCSGRLANSVADEPLLISQMTRTAAWGSICSCAERIVNATSFSDEQLACLQEMFAQAERPEALRRAVAGERACGFSAFGARFVRNGIPGYGPAPSGLTERIGRGLTFSAIKLTGILQRDRNFYLSEMETNLALAELDFPERFTIGQKTLASASAPSSFCVISRVILPALQNTLNKDAEHVARMRVAETGLAMERFRRAHNNALPKDLSELGPAYLKTLPSDPMDGKPLRFKLRENGYVIYSIGSDGKDDGGNEFDPRASAGTDVTFIAER